MAMDFSKPAPMERVNAVIAALKRGNIDAEFVPTGEEARKRVFAILPEGAEVMTMTSVTLDTLGIADEINSGGKFNSVRAELNAMDRKTQKMEQKKAGAAPAWAIGSVHAVTEKGEILVASNTGSQLPAYAYGAGNVLWVVGSQKLVLDMNEAMERLMTYTLPLESERARKAYGVPGSAVNKLLIVNKEVEPGRMRMLLVGESLGF